MTILTIFRFDLERRFHLSQIKHLALSEVCLKWHLIKMCHLSSKLMIQFMKE